MILLAAANHEQSGAWVQQRRGSVSAAAVQFGEDLGTLDVPSEGED